MLRFESVAFERQVELNSHIQPGLSLSGEPDSLERLVMILLDNAVKYAGEQGRVDVALSRRQERAVLSVRNTGEPIPPEHLEHLFERFYRVDGSRSPSSPTGARSRSAATGRRALSLPSPSPTVGWRANSPSFKSA